MATTKAIVRRCPAVKQRNTNGTVKSFKIKEILPEQKTIEI